MSLELVRNTMVLVTTNTLTHGYNWGNTKIGRGLATLGDHDSNENNNEKNT